MHVANLSWQEVYLVECMERSMATTSDEHCKTPKKLKLAIQNNCHAMVAFGLVFLLDNARLRSKKSRASEVVQMQCFFIIPLTTQT